MSKRKEKKKGPDRGVFEDEIRKLMESEDIRKMGIYEQHEGNNTLQHVRNVTYCSFSIAEKLKMNIDERSLARGSMLHDYYLYNIDEEGLSDYRHGVDHPRKALKNARSRFELNRKEENIILSHMWPLTLFHPPLCREAFLVCIADKYCAVNEMYMHRNNLEGKWKK